MATYITLINYTQKGLEYVKAGPNQLEEAKKVYKSMGAEIKDFYLVMGQYDAVLICEAPDDETAAKLAMTMGAKGSTRSQTLRAFREDEYRKIVSSLR